MVGIRFSGGAGVFLLRDLGDTNQIFCPVSFKEYYQNRSAKLTIQLHVAEVWNAWSLTSRRLLFLDFELLGAGEILVLWCEECGLWPSSSGTVMSLPLQLLRIRPSDLYWFRVHFEYTNVSDVFVLPFGSSSAHDWALHSCLSAIESTSPDFERFQYRQASINDE